MITRLGHATDTQPSGAPGTRTFVGVVEMECPHCQRPDVGIHTRDAAEQIQLPNGIRWVGVPCHVCGKTFTIESAQEGK